MPTITAAGTTVSYTCAGQGPGLVLVAGTGLPAQLNYGHLADAFSDRRTVILPDYAGSGQTTDAGGPLTVELLAGQSRPELVRRLVLVAGWPSPDDARHKLAIDLWQRLERTDHDLFTRYLQLTCFSAPFLSNLGEEGVTQLIAGAPPIIPGMRKQIELDRHADISKMLPAITAPTLVIGLTRDQVVPVERVRLLHRAITGSQYAEIDSGHVVVFEQPAELVRVCRDFLFEQTYDDPVERERASRHST
ncbi:MAG: alpha/beta hydrolase [Streptosporangiaceae bacterium]|nr:alpha/beta hydrolase [Streptosporangiaceae bacterium]MBV9855616.1 alpha/beta hydrolase [Streptosporangiaceae bacterium]